MEFSLKSDAEFTFPTQFQRKLGQNLKRLEADASKTEENTNE
ncbi:MAG: hypothetical protein ACFFB6_09345 [Promethearchaeota archaeon]